MTNEQAVALVVFLAVCLTIGGLIAHFVVLPLRQRMLDNQRREEIEVARAMYKRDIDILRDILDKEEGR